MDIFNCSFCGINHKETKVMISGPRVFICADCVQLCCEVLVEKKAVGSIVVIGNHVETLGEMGAQLQAAQGSERKLRSVVESIARVIASEIPTSIVIKCMWCSLDLNSDDEAKVHVASCEKHPAVIRLNAITKDSHTP